MEYLSTHVGDLPAWSITGIIISALLMILMFPVDAWIHRKQKDPTVSKLRLAATIVVFSVGLLGVFGSLVGGLTQIRTESADALSNLSYNLHQKYNFDNIKQIDGIDYNEIRKGELLWQEGTQKITITFNDKVLTYDLTQDQKTFEPSMTGQSENIIVDDLIKPNLPPTKE